MCEHSVKDVGKYMSESNGAASSDAVDVEVDASVDPKIDPVASSETAFGSGSVEASYQKNHAEIKRRQEFAQTLEEQNPRNFERATGGAEIPFRNDAQTHFVWSASTEGMAPRAKDARSPAIRIYGLFGSAEEAMEHAHVVAKVDPTCSLMISRTHEWVMVPRTPARMASEAEHIRAVLTAYKASRDESKHQFSENVANQRGGVGKTAAEEREDASATPPTTTDGSTDGGTEAPRRLGRDAEVRDQSIVAATFIKDTTQEVGEPIFRVYGAFENTTTGDAWARCAGDTVVDYDIDLCSSCVWLFINEVTPEKIAQEVYRSNELSSIMSNAKKQPKLVENFKKWREESIPKEDEGGNGTVV